MIAIPGHVTDEMQRHYSTVGIDEKRAAIVGVMRLVPPITPASANEGGGKGGVGPKTRVQQRQGWMSSSATRRNC